MFLADECDPGAFEAAEQLLDREQVGECLERMVRGRQHVEDGSDVHRGHLLEQCVVEHASGDDRVVAGKSVRYVGNALAAADTKLGRLKIDGMAAELRGRELH